MRRSELVQKTEEEERPSPELSRRCLTILFNSALKNRRFRRFWSRLIDWISRSRSRVDMGVGEGTVCSKRFWWFVD